MFLRESLAMSLTDMEATEQRNRPTDTSQSNRSFVIHPVGKIEMRICALKQSSTQITTKQPTLQFQIFTVALTGRCRMLIEGVVRERVHLLVYMPVCETLTLSPIPRVSECVCPVG